MELFLLSEITWQTRSFIRFAGPVGDCAIMLAVQRKTENIPIKTNQQKRNTSNMSTTKNLELVASFAGSVFTSDTDGNPQFATHERHVRKTAKSPERTVSFQAPILSVSDLQYYIKRGEALAEIPTEHVTKVKNEDGSTTETKRISNALSDLVQSELLDIAEDASEAYLSKGNTPDYFASFIYGVSADRETEKSVLKKIDGIKSEIGSLVFALAGEWNDDTARSLGVSDKDAAIAKQSNLIGSLAQLLAKANELASAKAKREAKKKTV